MEEKLSDKHSEIIKIVDENNNLVGTARRDEMRAKVLWHRSSFVLLTNSKNQYYVHLRHKNKAYCPHHHALFFGGCVGEHEEYDDNAEKEL
jgi:hypothetical protein